MRRRGSVLVRNRQFTLKVDARRLRWIVRALLQDLLDRDEFELAFYLVDAEEMTRVNERYLRHQGSTDVITFDYNDPAAPRRLAGEIFICLDEARVQARRFRTTWQNELVRYAVHAVLHLAGYDDQRRTERQKMKREENRLLRELQRLFYLPKLGGHRARGKVH